MDGFKDRLTLFVQSKEMSIRRFEEACGLANGTIGAIKSQGPTAVVVSKISEAFPDLNLNWLFRGTGSMFLGESSQPTPSVSIGTIQTVNIGNWDKLVELLKQQK